jgi:hypothetical protein
MQEEQLEEYSEEPKEYYIRGEKGEIFKKH